MWPQNENTTLDKFHLFIHFRVSYGFISYCHLKKYFTKRLLPFCLNQDVISPFFKAVYTVFKLNINHTAGFCPSRGSSGHVATYQHTLTLLFREVYNKQTIHSNLNAFVIPFPWCETEPNIQNISQSKQIFQVDTNLGSLLFPPHVVPWPIGTIEQTIWASGEIIWWIFWYWSTTWCTSQARFYLFICFLKLCKPFFIYYIFFFLTVPSSR